MSSRARPVRHSTNSTDFNSSILNCQTCMDIPEFPVTLCTGGHTVCNKCRQTRKACLVCNGGFTGVRNIVCENLIGKTRFKCQFAANGCDERIKGNEYHAHVKECTCRPVECRFNPCLNLGQGQGSVTMKTFTQHIRVKHGITGRVANEVWIQQKLSEIFLRQGFDASTIANSGSTRSKEFSTLPNYYLHIGDEIFFLNTVVYESMVYWWVTTMSPTEQTVDTYRPKFALKQRNKGDFNEVEWTGHIFSVTDSFLTIRHSISAVIPLLTLLELYGTYNGTNFDETTIRLDQDLTWELYYTVENTCTCDAHGHDYDDGDDGHGRGHGSEHGGSNFGATYDC